VYGLCVPRFDNGVGEVDAFELAGTAKSTAAEDIDFHQLAALD
jgi:hypothetical protein